MFEAITYQNMLSEINAREIVEGTIGILITRPDLATGKDIIESLPYYHHATGNNIDFFLPGYGAYWPQSEYPDKIDVAKIDDVVWSFSNKAFVQFTNDLEDYTKWKYSGESELILVSYCNGKFDYSSVFTFRLDQMLRDNTITSISSFFVELSRFAKKHNSCISTGFHAGMSKITKSLINEFINSLPSYATTTIKKGRHFIVKNYCK